MTLFDHLFSFSTMDDVLSDVSCVKYMLRFEAALAIAEARAGVIPEGAAKKIAEQCRIEHFDLAVVSQAAPHAGNIAIPLIRMLTEAVASRDKEAARFVHWGATSQDVMDTAFVLQLRDALALVQEDMERLTGQLANLARTHRNTVMVARTWMQQALPTTFGYVVAGWLDALLRQRLRLKEMEPRVLALQFGGAVGTLAALRSEGPRVADIIAQELRLQLPTAPWHALRDRMAEVATFCGLLAGMTGKIARDISLQSQTEIAELSEPTGEGRGSSSTMPHKRNPVTCSIVLAAAARAPGLVGTVLAAMPQEEQRGLGGWQAEWETLPQILRLSGGALHHLAEMLPGLEVHREQMQRNVEATNGLIYAEAVTMALADRMGKMPAHLLVEAACKKSVVEHRPLKDVLRREPGLHGHLTAPDLEGLFDARNYLGSSEQLLNNVLQQVQNFSQKD